MINPNLHKKAVVLDSNLHRQLRLGGPVDDWSIARDLNAMFLASVEFADACSEYPIVFVNAGTGEDGKRQPMDVKVGDKILFGKYSGSEVKLGDQEYLIMREEDVLGILQ